jgi:hypothetical protein
MGIARLPAAAIVVAAFVFGAAAPSQSVSDALTGKWELNLARTHYGGGAEPRQRESFVCRLAGAVLTCTIDSVRERGQHVRGGFTAAYDGAPGPTRGMPDMDHVRLHRVSTTISDATFMFNGHAVFAYRAVRSADGKSLTITSVEPVTRAVLNSVVVYDAR